MHVVEKHGLPYGPDNLLIARLLITCGADVNKPDFNGRTSLMLAQHDFFADGKDRLAMCQVLLEARASVHEVDRWGWSPLHWAAETDDVDMVRILIQNRADANLCQREGGYKSPLCVAATEGQLDNVRFLLEECNVNVNHADADGRTSLMRAILGSRGSDTFAVVKVLIEYRADMDKMDTDGENSLSMAVDREFCDIKSLLIEAGAKLRHSPC
eukprot:Skav202090  [mRNA]  locus=scaffold513:183893:184531:+ [translate_table: standard]